MGIEQSLYLAKVVGHTNYKLKNNFYVQDILGLSLDNTFFFLFQQLALNYKTILTKRQFLILGELFLQFDEGFFEAIHGMGV